MSDDLFGEYLANLPLEPNRNLPAVSGEEIMANIRRVQHLFEPKTLYTSPEDAPAVMLGVEADPELTERVEVQGHPWLAPGVAVLVDPRYLPPQSAPKPDPLMSGDAMDLDANDGYWRPE